MHGGIPFIYTKVGIKAGTPRWSAISTIAGDATRIRGYVVAEIRTSDVHALVVGDLVLTVIPSTE
jgi:hypothetical protein